MNGDGKRFVAAFDRWVYPASVVVGALVLGWYGKGIITDQNAFVTKTLIDWQEKQDEESQRWKDTLMSEISQMNGQMQASRDASARVETTLAVQGERMRQQALISDVKLWVAELARANPTMQIPPFNSEMNK